MNLKRFIFNKRSLIYLVVLIFLLIIPFILSPFNLILFESAITFAIVGLGFNLLLRYTGLLSFGHGAYFAAGAYAVAMVGRYVPSIYSIEFLIPIAIIASLVLSAIFGFICVRHTKIFFAILTLALSMLLFALLFKFYSVTGGSDGLYIPTPSIFGVTFKRRPEFLSGPYYYFLLVIFIICYMVMKVIVSSPFGKALQAIRDNETRAELIGIRVKRYRFYAFIISGTFAGIGGSLWTFVNGHVTPDVSHWFFSGEIVYMTLLGGFFIFEGPIIGAFVFTFLKLYAMGFTEYWMGIIGVTLILLVLLLPTGLAGGVVTIFNKLKTRKVLGGT
ncbi:branched-chain amino acid ABC transporter permease [Desulfobacterota bacterium AH_259_B03_O07]|nr:branched-chain amino acid ABC transporter permease [Desulfobacterota bacterium AH_259_B03_O07]